MIFRYLASRYYSYLGVFLIARLKKVSDLCEGIEEMTSIREKFSAMVDLMKLLFINVTVSHFCACAWHLVAFLP